MALAWKAGWVNALRGSNPLSSARRWVIPRFLGKRGITHGEKDKALILGQTQPSTETKAVHPITSIGPLSYPRFLSAEIIAFNSAVIRLFAEAAILVNGQTCVGGPPELISKPNSTNPIPGV